MDDEAMGKPGEPGEPGEAGRQGVGGTGGAGGVGGEGWTRGGAGGVGGAGGSVKGRGRRRSDRWRAVVGFAVILAAGSILLSAVLFVRVQDAVDLGNRERARNSISGCVSNSLQNQAILSYLSELGADPGDLEQAGEFFPVKSRAECERSASETITP